MERQVVQAGVLVTAVACGTARSYQPSRPHRRDLVETLLPRHGSWGTAAQRLGSHEFCRNCYRLVWVFLYSSRDAYRELLRLVWLIPNGRSF